MKYKKLAAAAVIFDALTIIAVILTFAVDLTGWAAAGLGAVAIVLNSAASSRRKKYLSEKMKDTINK